MNNIIWTVLSLSLSGTVMALLLFAGKPLFKNRVSKAFSYYIWLVVLLRLVLPIALPVNIMNTLFDTSRPASASAQPSRVTGAEAQTDSLSGNAGRNPAELPQINRAKNTTGDATPSKGAALLLLLWGFVKDNALWIWLLGFVVNFGWFMTAYLYFSQRIRLSCVTARPEDLEILKEISQNRRVRLVYSDEVHTPLLLGMIRPVIVLPQSIDVHKEFDEVKHILRHELTHFRRKDLIYKWAAMAVTSLHWFNPFMPIIRKEISKACELSCDEAVVSNMSASEKQQYGNTLLTFSAGKRIPSGTLATTLSTGKAELKERLVSIMKYRKKSTLAVALSLALGLALAGCATTLGFAGGAGNKPSPADSSSAMTSSTVVSSSSAAVSSSQSGKNGYYGSWKTTACIAKSAVYALSEQEIKDQIGTVITFESNLYKKGTAEMKLSGYEETTTDSKQFQKDFGIPLSNLGITKDAVTAVAVGAEGNYYGGIFYIKDNNTLVIYYEGVFFEAKRV